MASTYILGISAFYHDSAACLLQDGVIVSASQEERFSRRKGDAAFPRRAVADMLERAGITAARLDAVAFYDKPLLKLDRLLETYFAIAPRGRRQFQLAAPAWVKERLLVGPAIREALGGFEGVLLFCEHHESHAASAFFPSPFPEAAILTVDGVGEWATASIGVGRGRTLELTRELHWPDSLGLLYSAFTAHAGFTVNSGEYKLMGLAPYGEPRYVERIYRRVMDLREDGSFTLDQRYFDYMGGLTMTSPAFSALFDGPPRIPESPLTQRELDLARSVQVVCEEVVMRMARTARRDTSLDQLVIAGGVGLNAVANGRLLREGPFRELWIQPAAGDAGGAIGAAFLAWHRWFAADRSVDGVHDQMRGAYLGPSITPHAAAATLRQIGASAVELGDDQLLARVAQLLAQGNVVGWVDGAMEFGPRALGARSILADARNPAMQSALNRKIKFREGFRPFAPSVLAERAAEWFDLEGESPYMLIVAPVKPSHRHDAPASAPRAGRAGIDLLDVPRSDIPAVTHLDYSARVQTVSAERAPRFHALISEFERLTGCPILVNTSFNVRGEPIVCTTEDAYACFMQTDIDYLVVPPFLLAKADQADAGNRARWHRPLQPD